MSDHYIQMGMLLIQVLALCGLVWYTVETRQMRAASEAQVEISQKLIAAAMDQVEGLSKPCIILATKPRDHFDALVGLGVVGSVEALEEAGNFLIKNIGNGVACNLSYSFTALNDTVKFHNPNGPRYLPNILPGESTRTVESVARHNGEFLVVFQYTSLGGRSYETRLSMTSYVFTDFRFGEIKLSLSA